ncbi:hypothetical protein OK016_16970 [Vibrio chagasii]|nr:hypothetical protein [Vibrio chagasii]
MTSSPEKADKNNHVANTNATSDSAADQANQKSKTTDNKHLKLAHLKIAAAVGAVGA